MSEPLHCDQFIDGPASRCALMLSHVTEHVSEDGRRWDSAHTANVKLRDAVAKLRADLAVAKARHAAHVDSLNGEIAARREQVKQLMDPIVRAQMLRPAPPIMLKVDKSAGVLKSMLDAKQADLAEATALLREVQQNGLLVHYHDEWDAKRRALEERIEAFTAKQPAPKKQS